MDNFNTKTTENTTNTWLTPPDLLKKLGRFDLDTCAAVGRPWDCAERNYTVEENGLLQRWSGRVWCNPPYGKEAAAFVARMTEHKLGLALIFMRPDTRWFQDYVLASARYLFLLRGRVRFCRIDGTPGQAPNAASCLVAWDKSELALLEELQAQGMGKLAYLRKEAA